MKRALVIGGVLAVVAAAVLVAALVKLRNAPSIILIVLVPIAIMFSIFLSRVALYSGRRKRGNSAPGLNSRSRRIGHQSVNAI
jgi:hypothetical protein